MESKRGATARKGELGDIAGGSGGDGELWKATSVVQFDLGFDKVLISLFCFCPPFLVHLPSIPFLLELFLPYL